MILFIMKKNLKAFFGGKGIIILENIYLLIN